MRFITIIPFTFWLYLALAILALSVFGPVGLVIAVVIMMVLR